MLRVAVLVAAGAALMGCQSAPQRPLPHVARVDLARLMGDWYVIANIPTPIERGAHNAVESYRLADDGTVETTFTFRAGSFDGALKTYHARGYIRDPASNAVWGMQFVWPFKADYHIAYLAEDYRRTVIARERRDYVWIMSRTPSLSEADFRELLRRVADLGYDVARVRRVPQRWDGSAPGP